MRTSMTMPLNLCTYYARTSMPFTILQMTQQADERKFSLNSLSFLLLFLVLKLLLHDNHSLILNYNIHA